EGIVYYAVFSPDGSRIVTASEDNTARIWDVRLPTIPREKLLFEACVRLAGVTKLTREDTRLAGYPDSMPEIDAAITSCHIVPAAHFHRLIHVAKYGWATLEVNGACRRHTQ